MDGAGRIAFFELEDWEEARLRKVFGGEEDGGALYFREPLAEKNIALAAGCWCVCVFIYSKVGRAELSKLAGLKLVATRSTGYDHIDLAACGEAGVRVCNVPYYGENTVAEHTFALLLSLSRKIHVSYERTRRADFSIEGLRGFDLRGRTIGVVGTGHIGQHAIRMARGFEMEVIAHDAFPQAGLEERLGFRYVTLDELCARSDIVTLHVPYNKETHHMINAGRLAMMRKGAILLNTARGGSWTPTP